MPFCLSKCFQSALKYLTYFGLIMVAKELFVFDIQYLWCHVSMLHNEKYLLINDHIIPER